MILTNGNVCYGGLTSDVHTVRGVCRFRFDEIAFRNNLWEIQCYSLINNALLISIVSFNDLPSETDLRDLPT